MDSTFPGLVIWNETTHAKTVCTKMHVLNVVRTIHCKYILCFFVVVVVYANHLQICGS